MIIIIIIITRLMTHVKVIHRVKMMMMMMMLMVIQIIRIPIILNSCLLVILILTRPIHTHHSFLFPFQLRIQRFYFFAQDCTCNAVRAEVGRYGTVCYTGSSLESSKPCRHFFCLKTLYRHVAGSIQITMHENAL